MGHYDECYEADERDALKKRHSTPEWQEWDKFRRAFLSSQVSNMTVRQLLMGMERLKREP